MELAEWMAAVVLLGFVGVVWFAVLSSEDAPPSIAEAPPPKTIGEVAALAPPVVPPTPSRENTHSQRERATLLAIPSEYVESLDFEDRVRKKFSRREIDKLFYVKVAGTAFLNDDGSSRSEAVKACEPLESLKIKGNLGLERFPMAVGVFRKDGAQLGYLSSRLADQVTRDRRDTKKDCWRAVFCRQGFDPETKTSCGAVLCIVRLLPGG